jgi:hypothetical protein
LIGAVLPLLLFVARSKRAVRVMASVGMTGVQALSSGRRAASPGLSLTRVLIPLAVAAASLCAISVMVAIGLGPIVAVAAVVFPGVAVTAIAFSPIAVAMVAPGTIVVSAASFFSSIVVAAVRSPGVGVAAAASLFDSIVLTATGSAAAAPTTGAAGSIGGVCDRWHDDSSEAFSCTFPIVTVVVAQFGA